MSHLTSDLTLSAAKLHAPTDPTTAFSNEQMIEMFRATPKWWDLGAAEYRRQHEGPGIGSQPPLVYLDSAIQTSVPSRDTGREIPCRLLKPASGNVEGVIMHIHGGGWVLFSEKTQDSYLKQLADAFEMVIVSVGYRLAPENPFPAGPKDCYDVADWLVDNAEKEYGAPLKFATGDSAGAHLALLSHLHLTKSRPDYLLNGLILSYGMYNLGALFPSVNEWDSDIVIDREFMTRCLDAFLPSLSVEQRCDPSVSPFFAKLDKDRMPPALFLCGELDPLLDDSVFMATRWQAAGGGESILKLFTGAPHAFNLFPEEVYPGSKESWEAVGEFVRKYT